MSTKKYQRIWTDFVELVAQISAELATAADLLSADPFWPDPHPPAKELSANPFRLDPDPPEKKGALDPLIAVLFATLKKLAPSPLFATDPLRQLVGLGSKDINFSSAEDLGSA